MFYTPVLMQVNSLPLLVHDARVNIISGLRNQFGISTSLTILARVVSVKLYDETMQENEAHMNRFKEIAEAQFRLCKEKERQYGGGLDISEIKYSTEMSVSPFLIPIPEKAYHEFKRYSCGTKINMVPVTVVSSTHGSLHLHELLHPLFYGGMSREQISDRTCR
jgi:hypothetical protein